MSVSLCGLAQTERIVILHTNDTHSQMEPFAVTHKTYGGLGGAMRRMAIIDSIRNAEPNVLLVRMPVMLFKGHPISTFSKAMPNSKR